MTELFKAYPLKNYYVTQEFIENKYEEYELDELIELLEKKDCGYHFRINESNSYRFFGDIDGYNGHINTFLNDLIVFLKDYYGLTIASNDIKYTANKSKNGSYHYSIPTLYASCKKLKEIHLNFKSIYNTEMYKYKINNITKECIDTSIYSNHWFRYPLQSKESVKNSQHVIVTGSMIDFIHEYIPTDCICIDTYNYKNMLNQQVKPKNQIVRTSLPKTNIIKENNIISNDDIDMKLRKSKYHKQYKKYKDLFDNCFDQKRFDEYEYWISIGMALKNIYDMDAFELFNYFSLKSSKYEGYDKTLYKYKSFKYNYEKGYTIAMIYKYAQEDNLMEYKKIMLVNDVSFGEHDFAKTIYEFASDIFIYQKKKDGKYQIYCYNGKFWEADDLLLRKYISTTLYEYYKELVHTVYFDSLNLRKLKNQIEDLKKIHIKRNIIETYKEFGVKPIEFDMKWWLLGFTNMVLDLHTHTFRDYNIDDYVSITTDYEWLEPSKEQIETVKNIIKKIMPIKNERTLYKQILSTSLEGRCLEKFIVFNGKGRNGKGAIDELLVMCLGNYALYANSAILFETSKTGSNPELANFNKKRLIIFKEPSSKKSFENSIIKEITGGGKISARGHHESDTEKMLHGTVICECNDKPKLSGDPKTAEIDRFIDIPFRSTFTQNDEELNDEEYYFKANPLVKDNEFRQEHKYALLQILINAHKKYTMNKFKFVLPDSVKLRTMNYLESGCHLLQWFKDQYTYTSQKDDMVKIMDIYNNFKDGEYYMNLSKKERREHNYRYFIEYFSENIITKKNYRERYGRQNFKNILLGWKLIEKHDTDIVVDTELDI